MCVKGKNTVEEHRTSSAFHVFKYHKPVSYKKGHSAFIKSFSYVLRIERREIKFQHLIKHKSSIYKIKTRDQKN